MISSPPTASVAAPRRCDDRAGPEERDAFGGHAIATRRRAVWFGVYGVALFGFIAVLLRPQSPQSNPGGAPLFTVIALFVLFGGGSLLFRWWFSRPVTVTAEVVPSIVDLTDHPAAEIVAQATVERATKSAVDAP